jgi:hypothetical protein
VYLVLAYKKPYNLLIRLKMHLTQRFPSVLFSACLVTMRSWVQVLETVSCRNTGKCRVHKTQSGQTLRKRELRAPGCPLRLLECMPWFYILDMQNNLLNLHSRFLSFSIAHTIHLSLCKMYNNIYAQLYPMVAHFLYFS